MKKQIFAIALGLVMTVITSTTTAGNANHVIPPASKATEKALKDFSNQFKNAINPTLYALDNGYILKSPVNDLMVTSAYSKKGNWVYSISRYNNSSFAKNVVDIVKHSYGTYNISLMEKVEQPGTEPVYVVHINDDKTIKTIRVTNNEIELIHDFLKA